MGNQYDNQTTDELLEQMPDSLLLAKNSNAPEHDRWIVFNRHTKKYVEPGFRTARDLMTHVLKSIDEQRKEWMSTDVSEVTERESACCQIQMRRAGGGSSMKNLTEGTKGLFQGTLYSAAIIVTVLNEPDDARMILQSVRLCRELAVISGCDEHDIDIIDNAGCWPAKSLDH